MQPRIPFRHFGTDSDVARLGQLVREAFLLVGFVPDDPATVLNLACGRADETGALFHALTPARVGFYLGIDLLPGDIAEAKARWRSADPSVQIDFKTGDASRTDKMRQLPPFDLVFIRHQNFWHDGPQWDRLLENSLNSLKPRGILAFTSYFDREHALALASLKTCGAEQLVNIRHAASRALDDAPGKSVDRHLAIVAKPS